MVAKTFVYALLCAAAATATPAPANTPPKVPKECETFSYDKLSLREVGARNSLVRLPPFPTSTF
jgi:hypothetical protein